MKVMVVEDDAVHRQVLLTRLQKWGFEVVTAKDGEAAWEMLQAAEAPRLVILDWMMPRMDGLELCRKVRERTEHAYVYILMLTARNRREDILQGLSAGVDDYVTKPFDPRELNVRLRAGARILDLQERLQAACEKLRLAGAVEGQTEIEDGKRLFDLTSLRLENSWHA